jgi:hypothetical protein
MTLVSSSSESMGPLAASSSSSGALASIAASMGLLVYDLRGGFQSGEGGYFVAWLDFSFGTPRGACHRGEFARRLRAWLPWSGSCR